LNVGGIYAFETGDGGIYGIAKVFDIDKKAVYLRTYTNNFVGCPTTVDVPTLAVGSPDYDCSILITEFLSWEPTLLVTDPVSPTERNSYHKRPLPPWMIPAEQEEGEKIHTFQRGQLYPPPDETLTIYLSEPVSDAEASVLNDKFHTIVLELLKPHSQPTCLSTSQNYRPRETSFQLGPVKDKKAFAAAITFGALVFSDSNKAVLTLKSRPDQGDGQQSHP